MFCARCGTQIYPGESFCGMCGWAVPKEAAETANSPASVEQHEGIMSQSKEAVPMAGDPAVREIHIDGAGDARDYGMQGDVLRNSAAEGSTGVDGAEEGRVSGTEEGRSVPAQDKRTHRLAMVLCGVTAFLVLATIITIAVLKGGTADVKDAAADGKARSSGEGTHKTLSTEERAAADARVAELITATEQYLDETLPDVEGYGDSDIEELGRIYSEAAEGVGEYYDSFLSVEGADDNIYAAGEEYYTMLNAYLSEFSRVTVFYAEVKDLYDSINVWDWDMYDTPAEFYEKTNAHIEELKERYDSIDCPDCLQAPWKSIEDYFTHMDEAYYRLCLGVEMNDLLRSGSGMSILDHIDITRDLRFRDMYDIIDEVISLNAEQAEKSALIYDEIIKAAALPDDERAAYEFKNTFKDDVLIHYDAVDTIYPSLYNSYDRLLIIELGCISGERDAVVNVKIPGLTGEYTQSLHINPAISALCIKIPVDPDANIDRARDSQMEVKITGKDGSLIDAQTFPVHVKGRNDFEWVSDEFGVVTKDNILCFLQPDSASIAGLKRSAINYLEALNGGAMPGIVGYQGPYFDSTYVTTFLQASALMCAMSDMGVRYNMDGFSIDGSNQHILLPEQVLEQKGGLCIETSLVIASALQSAGMHTFLVLPEGHAQVAVETWSGSGEYFLIETTRLPNNLDDFLEYANYLLTESVPKETSCPITYMRPEDWDKYIQKYNVYLIDCADGAFLGLTPFVH